MAFLNKYIDYLSNIMAFGLYIFIQQLVLIPILSRFLDNNEFSKVVLFMTILNIVSIVIGTELGNTRIIEAKKVSKDSVYNSIFLGTILVSLPISSIVYIYIYPFITTFLLCLITFFLCSFKQYISAYFRLTNNFSYILYGNFFYALGIIAGITTFYFMKNPILPFLMGELLTVIYLWVISQRKKLWNPNIIFFADKQYKRIACRSYSNLFFVSLLLNSLSYLDRFIIGPILGLSVISIYYSASAMSKFLLLLVNPVNSVLLAKLSNQEKRISYVTFFKIQIVILIISCVISIIASYFGILLLYNKYFIDAMSIIVPVGIAAGLSITSLISKTFILVEMGTTRVIRINIVYGAVFVISAILLSNVYGLQGFAWASVGSRAVQLIQYFLLFVKKEDRDEA